MTDRSEHSRFCGSCGKPLQETDRFCGSCGASVLPNTSDNNQVIPKDVAAAQGAAYGGSRRRIVGGVVVAAVALLVIGVAAAFAFGGGLGLREGSDGGQQEAGRPVPPSAGQGETTTPTGESDTGAPKRTLTENEETSTALPDAESDTDARIEAFVEKYYEAVEQGDWSQTYSLLAYASREQFTEAEWVEAQEIRQSAEGRSSPLASVGEIEVVEEFVVSVGLTFSDGTTGETTVFVPPNGEEPRRILSNDDVAYLRDLLEEEETGLQTVDSPAVEQFVYEYYAAVEAEDWSATYEMLSYDSKEQFTESEWIETQESRQAVSGPPGSVTSVEARAGEDYPADQNVTVTVTFSDGTSADIRVVDTHGPDGLVRVLTDDEVSYLESL